MFSTLITMLSMCMLAGFANTVSAARRGARWAITMTGAGLLAGGAWVLLVQPNGTVTLTTQGGATTSTSIPVVSVAVSPGSQDENTWSDPSAPSNIGPGTADTADETAMLQVIGWDREPVTGTVTVRVIAYHVGGITKVGCIWDGGTEVFNTSPVAATFDYSDWSPYVVARWKYRIYQFVVDTSELTFSGGRRLTKLWFRTYATDGQNRVASIELDARQGTITPTETKYVALTTNSPSNGNDGSAAHPWATLDYALDTIADGGWIYLVDAGNYTQTRRSSFRDDARHVRVTTSLPKTTQTITVNGESVDIQVPQVQIRGDGGGVRPRMKRLWYSGVTLYTTSFGGYDAGYDTGSCHIVVDDCFVTGAGRAINAAGPAGSFPWISQYADGTNHDDFWSFTNSRAYDVVYGLFNQRSDVLNCTIEHISYIPFGFTTRLVYNVFVDDFVSADWIANESPDPFPIGSGDAASVADNNTLGFAGALSGSIDNSTTTITLASATGSGGFPLPGAGGSVEGYPYFLKIQSEYVKVTARSGTTLTVQRGQRSTSEVSHADGTAVYSQDAIAHPDVVHELGGLENRIIFGLRTGSNVLATMFRSEMLVGDSGSRKDLLRINCEMNCNSVNGNDGGVHSDQTGPSRHIVYDNVYNPRNPWDFILDGGTHNQNYSATNCYFIDCGLHWRNAVPWILGIQTFAAAPPSGVTHTGDYQPADGFQPQTCTVSVSGGVVTWTASGWPDRSRAQLYITDSSYGAITHVDEIATSGTYDDSANAGTGRHYYIREENDGTGEKKYSNVGS